MTSPDPAAPPVESRYLDYLPAIFRTPPEDRQASVLGQFLRAFEDVLTGTGDPTNPGLAEVIGGIAPDVTGQRRLAGLYRYFEPGTGLESTARTPTAFLDWLAGWVALSLRADLDEETQREFIAKAVSLYRLRGTPKGLAAVLGIYTRLGVTIDEGETGFRVGKTSTVGVDTVLGGFVPHYFEVTLRRSTPVPKELATTSLPDELAASSLPAELARYKRIATEIIEAEKPAHCFYRLKIISVSFQINVASRVGIDTLLGSVST